MKGKSPEDVCSGWQSRNEWRLAKRNVPIGLGQGMVGLEFPGSIVLNAPAQVQCRQPRGLYSSNQYHWSQTSHW